MKKLIPINQIKPDPNQPRQEFDPERLEQLKNSINQHGILNPLILEKKNGKYLIIDGERRYKMAKELRWKEVPAEVLDEMSIKDRMVYRFHLQEQHESWTFFDKARAVTAFRQEEGLSLKAIADILGLAEPTIREWLSILSFSRRSQKYITQNKIPYSYVTRANRIINSLEETIDTRRSEIEGVMLEKLQDRKVTSSSELTHLQQLMNRDPKIAKEFIEDKKMTAKEAINKSTYGQKVKIDRLANWARSLKTQFNKQISNSSEPLTDYQIQSLQDLQRTIQDILKQ